MAAFSAAWAAGAAWVEADTQPTADGVPVVLHDDDLDRTTNGSGPVREATARAVAALDAGSSFAAEFAGERVPELGTLLDELSGGRALLLEIKGRHTDDQLAAVCDAVRGSRHDDRVFFESFETDELCRLAGRWTGRSFGLLVHQLDADPVAAARWWRGRLQPGDRRAARPARRGVRTARGRSRRHGLDVRRPGAVGRPDGSGR